MFLYRQQWIYKVKVLNEEEKESIFYELLLFITFSLFPYPLYSLA